MKRYPGRAFGTLLLIPSLAVLASCDVETSRPPVQADAPTIESADPGLLRTIMIQLGVDMDEISRGLWLEDFSAVVSAATAIADHPHVSAPERTRIQSVLGADFAQFIKGDKRVHAAAVRLATAAAANDLSATLEELAQLQTACVACHSEQRDRLR